MVDKINSRKVKEAIEQAPGVVLEIGQVLAIEAIKTVAISAAVLLFFALMISLGQ